jgi:dihydroorotase
VLLSLTLALGSVLPSIAAGAIAVVGFGLGWMAGVMAGISTALGIELLGRVAEVSRWLLPSDGLWRGVAQGVVDVLGSDHAPHTLEEKAKPYPESPSGMTGVQTLVPLLLDHVNAGRLTLQRFVDLTSAGAARLFGLAGKGRVAVGYDADLTIVDMKRRETIRNSWIASRVGWTPCDGKEVTGWPVGTFVRGAKVMWEGELVTPAQGAPMRFWGAL